MLSRCATVVLFVFSALSLLWHTAPMHVPDFVARLAYCLHRAFCSFLACSILLIDRCWVHSKRDVCETLLIRVMTQTVGRQSATVEVRERSQASPFGVCGGQNGTGLGFSPWQYRSTSSLDSFHSPIIGTV